MAARELRPSGRTSRYVHGDPALYPLDPAFDAVVGRYVLMFQPHPVPFLRAVARHACPGGVVCFHELDGHGVISEPPVPTFDRLTAWNTEVTRRYGADPHFGSSLYAVYLAAGLARPTPLADAVHGQGAGGRGRPFRSQSGPEPAGRDGTPRGRHA